ncbi:MAG TPA: nucleotide pyrophosphohydrolase, partial [Isosphaeraceae bacterium]|nr:nucleotide pyrophosphohydrolase [Isosphaeraceae bacterium]
RMTDREATVETLKRWVLEFSRERNWEQFHHPKDLAVALACEVGELLEHVRYRTNAEIQAHLEQDSSRQELAHELADCLWLILRLADVCDLDLTGSLREKLDLAAVKYPIDKAFGRPDKYTTYQSDDNPAS